MSIKIITDSGCDLSLDYVKENNIEVVPLMVNINGKFSTWWFRANFKSCRVL